jgi:hypothetical protein
MRQQKRDSFLQEVTELRALHMLDFVDSRVIIEWAEQKLSEGASATYLRDLAEIVEPRKEDVAAIFAAISGDLGLPQLSEEIAARTAAQLAAKDLVQGAQTPIDTARRIWGIAQLVPSVESQLLSFIGLASEWEDDPNHRSEYEDYIRAEARRFLARDM